MQRDQLKIAGIVAAVIVGVGVVAAGAMAAGVAPVSDQETPAEQSTPTETAASDDESGSNTPGNLGDDVVLYPDPNTVEANITVGDGSVAGATTYTLTNNASESTEVKITPGVDDDNEFSRVQPYELEPGDSVRATFNGSANYSLTVDVVGGATETYDVTVDCNIRQIGLALTPEGGLERGPSASTSMACLEESP